MAITDYLPVLSSLLAGELAQMRRRSGLQLEPADISRSTSLMGGDAAIEPSEIPQLAAAIDEMFHLSEQGAGYSLLHATTVGDWTEAVSCARDTITFKTSGSTGKPKCCSHRLKDLEREAEEHAAAFRGCGRILSMAPAHHVYGFTWAVMLPGQLNVEVVDIRRWSPSKLSVSLQPGDLIVGTLPFWRYLSEFADVFPFQVRGVTSGEPCPGSLFSILAQQGLWLTDVYGATETGGVGSRSSGEDPFDLFSFWHKGSSGKLMRGVDGEVELPDLLDWKDERHFAVRGRKDAVVQIRGAKVIPQRVADYIRSHPAVKDCCVRLMRPEEGDRLKAFVVWRGEARAGREMEEWLFRKLQPDEIPASIVFGHRLPRNEMGKLSDWDCPVSLPLSGQQSETAYRTAST
jgi:4-coumarate--CoA ligase